MESKGRAWLLVLVVAVLCGAAVWGVAYIRLRMISGTEVLLKRLPGRDAMVVSIDFAALRRAGLLQLLSNSTVSSEPEYQDFVAKTEFDYTSDLDSALMAFAPDGKYFLVKGRFDWKRLRSYVGEEGGRCNNTLCQVAGSSAERQISFFPLRSDLMALAVSRSTGAALILNESRQAGQPFDIPRDPVWVSIPAATLKSGEGLPEGTRMFARTLASADHVLLSAGPAGDRFQARLDVRCGSERDAAALTAELRRATSMLRDMIQRERHAPNPKDLSGVLTAGEFHQQGRRVTGTWPIQRAFVEEMLGGLS